MRVVVLGGAGFVGSAVVAFAERAGHTVVAVPAPRLSTSARGTAEIVDAARRTVDEGVLLELRGGDAVINAAGVASPGAPLSDALVGANALLPAVVALRMGDVPGRRLVHVSSAAVFGSVACMDETHEVVPRSPYGVSKRLGETAVLACASDEVEAVVYRPTSVHGPGRAVTRSLVRLSRSSFSSVAGGEDRPTPQVLVENVAACAVFLAEQRVARPPSVVLHPWEGATTAGILRGLSGGMEPRRVPAGPARAVVASARSVGRASTSVLKSARRLEMLWFGQAQAPGWLDVHGPGVSLTWPEAYAPLVAASRGGQAA